MSKWFEKTQRLREIINNTVKEIVDQDLVETKGWLLIIVDEAKQRKGSYGIKYIGDDITYSSINICRDSCDLVEAFGNSMKKWFERKIER